ncbi:MAG: DNA-binding domain-containing protein [Bacteriovoracaceae bacterium]
MKPTIPLNTLQRWMQSVIEHPGTNDEAWHSEQAVQQLPFDTAYGAVLPSSTLTPVERIAIYRRMFFLRMTESMTIDYPAVKWFFGEEEFDRIVTEEYVQKYPSRSYTLNHLGRHFPEFFRESSIAEKEFLADLATLELSITNNLEAEEKPLITQQQIASVRADQWGSVRLIPIAAIELLELNHNACEFLDAVNEETEVPTPVRKRTYVVVYRNSFRSYWEALSAQQFVLLSSLVSGKQFGDAIVRLAEQFPGTEEQLQNDLFYWFNEWIAKGLFSDLTVT